MTSKDKHQKHVHLAKPDMGDYGRIELGFLGTSCGNIQKLAHLAIEQLSSTYKIAYVDADHKEGDALIAGKGDKESLMQFPDAVELRDKIVFKRLDRRQEQVSIFEQREWLNNQELVLINANHFKAKDQVLVIDPKKPMERKLSKITRVRLLVLQEGQSTIPEYIKEHIQDWEQLPVINIAEVDKIVSFIKEFTDANRAEVNGLVLIGGKSSRMNRDKSGLTYHDKSQKDHVRDLLQKHCKEVFLSCNEVQNEGLQGEYLTIKDKIAGLGPMGGVLSAFMENPDTAWLSVACDLPFLTEETIAFLLKNRNPSKLATVFLDSDGKFPEPLITIWEPRAYPVLLRYLSQGYSCPRKVLINSDVEILQAPDVQEFQNVNDPEAYASALKTLKKEEI
ncbi:NTP transferase domain-containing protein [Cyclobacterium sp. 1_MG-2023]|uniref:NTP transferase domain-containing protein n=1 Tax=Cyclobacterium sp. 1_MG-2023 TaxID=3062681 RepID=UPI0026E3C322|nr:NTP transferase domain-containing protein [Cyclobacterium sp. 1_MG-2023]MDO6436837.1 NTP transferase domain-containing protein [Cyclobacterium sp. 1_MG-2023]